jgi:hypothetical protein
MEALLTNTTSMVYTVHRQELNWVQNNPIFLELVAKQLNIFGCIH